MPEETDEWELNGREGVHLREPGHLVWYQKESAGRFERGGAVVQT